MRPSFSWWGRSANDRPCEWSTSPSIIDAAQVRQAPKRQPKGTLSPAASRPSRRNRSESTSTTRSPRLRTVTRCKVMSLPIVRGSIPEHRISMFGHLRESPALPSTTDERSVERIDFRPEVLIGRRSRTRVEGARLCGVGHVSYGECSDNSGQALRRARPSHRQSTSR